MSVNTVKPRSFESVIGKIAKAANLDKSEWIQLRSAFQRQDVTLNDDGSIKQQANISGRAEPLSATLQNVTSAGELSSADHVAADGSTFGRVSVNALTSNNVDFSKSGVTNKSTDNLTDGTGTPLTGGKRAAVAIDANNRIANSFRNNALNTASVSTSSSGLSNDGTTTVVTVIAQSLQFGAGLVAYNSGSYDPASFTVSYGFADDSSFAGGAVAYQFSTTPPNEAASDSRMLFGRIATINGTIKTGGGYSGGSTTGGANTKGIIA